MTRILIRNARVFDSRVVREPSNVVITRSAGNIQDPTNDGSAADVSDIIVDGQGCTLIPGLIDAYVNIKDATAAVGAFASHGVTTVVDLSSNTQQCQALRVYAAGRTKLPTFLTSGTQAAPARDYQPEAVDDNPGEAVVSTPEEAAAFVASRATGPDRADFIKVFVPTLLMMRKRASSTGSGGSGSVQRDDGGPGTMNRGSYDNAAASVRALHAAGATICAGTTANLVPGASVPFGESLHEEMRLLAEAGMPALDVLRSATCVAAAALRLGDRGIVRAGLRADLLLVEGNPLEDISAVRRIRRIWIRGEDVEPEHGG